MMKITSLPLHLLTFLLVCSGGDCFFVRGFRLPLLAVTEILSGRNQPSHHTRISREKHLGRGSTIHSKGFSLVVFTLGLIFRPWNAYADQAKFDLTVSEPKITDTCWIDLKIGDREPAPRFEISLYGKWISSTMLFTDIFSISFVFILLEGDITPATVENFKKLCLNEEGYGYTGSEVFRVVPSFSVQMGNIGFLKNSPLSQRAVAGKSAINSGKGFQPENFRVKHDFPSAGVVSMMKDKEGNQDSRFFVTLSPLASWADEKYVAFGRVSRGMEILSDLQNIEVSKPSNHPTKDVSIIRCDCSRVSTP